jgi:hypothetical protein
MRGMIFNNWLTKDTGVRIKSVAVRVDEVVVVTETGERIVYKRTETTLAKKTH